MIFEKAVGSSFTAFFSIGKVRQIVEEESHFLISKGYNRKGVEHSIFLLKVMDLWFQPFNESTNQLRNEI
jgi:hypothetical protein